MWAWGGGSAVGWRSALWVGFPIESLQFYITLIIQVPLCFVVD
jgi:hypothetical protein